jgi:protein SERAC1
MSNCCASIVFVHGLTGGQTTTWTAEGAKATWPELLLSDDIPEARISAFGYDADVVKFLGQTSQNKIGQHANNLLSDLADMRFDSNTVSTISRKSRNRLTLLI